MQFYSKNKFEKLVHLVGLLQRKHIVLLSFKEFCVGGGEAETFVAKPHYSEISKHSDCCDQQTFYIISCCDLYLCGYIELLSYQLAVHTHVDISAVHFDIKITLCLQIKIETL